MRLHVVEIYVHGNSTNTEIRYCLTQPLTSQPFNLHAHLRLEINLTPFVKGCDSNFEVNISNVKR